MRFEHLVNDQQYLFDGSCYKNGSISIKTRCTDTANKVTYLDLSDKDDCSTVTSTVALTVDRDCQKVDNVQSHAGTPFTLAYKALPVPANPHCMHSYQEYVSLEDCNQDKPIAATETAALTLPDLVGRGNTDAKRNNNC